MENNPNAAFSNKATPTRIISTATIDIPRCCCISVIHFKYGEDGRLWNFHIAALFHAFFTFFLLLQQFLLPRYVTAITLGGYVLAQCFNGSTGHHLVANGCLNGHIEHLARN